MKYTKTKYPNIYTYETTKGKRYYVRRSFMFQGKKQEANKSSLKTISEARAELAKIEKRIADQTIAINPNVTVEEYWEKFYEKRVETGRWTPNTEVYYKSTFKLHILPFWGKTKLKNLSRNEYEKHIANLLKVRPKASVRIIHSCFMTMLNDAIMNGNISANRLNGIYVGDSLIAKKNKRITLDQFQIWMQEAEKVMDKTFFGLTYLAIFGLRRGEILGLRHCDVNINVNGRAVLHLQDSRGNHTKNGRHGLKTKSSERWVTLDNTGTELLLSLMSNAEAVKKKLNIIKEVEWDYISIDQKGRLINPNKLNREFERVNDVVGFRVTPHMLRHFFTTQSIIAGVPMEALSQALGHTKMYMTDKYNQVHDELSAQVSDAFIAQISPRNSPTNLHIL
ncbi:MULTISPECIES: tyrosine-type recombinase/integrase [Streptococcus]|nr:MULTISPECIES: site-specific integrase [Streptococcus]KAA9305178.1 tyrosine-type recombinase/integrase [Streptococcus anginosus]KAA9320479.1 tyrosine-type recombinase/integrase [Streptococcus anginosus]MCW1000222.1 site-specific integrase [Streptococcus anginosus]MDB8648153.1 tyrosine-type recombinase/integrase [Streptococcus anginosus]MED5791444.1 tyrosine-type recombinase/integrase [Streptococcus anginosus]